MSSFHQATTTRLASRAAPSSSEDSAMSIACSDSSRHLFKMPCRKTQYVEAQSRRALVSRYKGSGRAAAPIFQYVLSITWGGLLCTAQSVGHLAGQEMLGAPVAARACCSGSLRGGPGMVTCWYAGRLLRSCSTALAYAALTQVAGWFSLLFPFSLFGLVALKYPAGHKERTVRSVQMPAWLHRAVCSGT